MNTRTRHNSITDRRAGRTGRWPAVFALMAAAIVCTSSAGAVSGAMPERLIVRSVDENDLVTLAGNTRPEAVAVNDRGVVYLQMNRSPAREKAAAELVEKLHDRTSPQYHQWLAADEVAERFGPSPDEVAALTDWLGSHGFTVHNVYAANGVIDFAGSAGAVHEAFHTEIHNLNVGGRAHIGNVSDPKIPAALAPAIRGIVSLHDFRPKPTLRPRANRTGIAAYDVGNGGFPLVPGDLQTIYNMTPLYRRGVSGQGSQSASASAAEAGIETAQT